MEKLSIDIDTGLETKAGVPHDAVVTHGEMMRAFEAFKETNDERLAKRDGDVVLEQKLVRIGDAIDTQARRLDEITLKASRPALGEESNARLRTGAPEHKAAFEAYMRSGRAAICARWKSRRCRSARTPTAAIWCRRRSRRPSASG